MSSSIPQSRRRAGAAPPPPIAARRNSINDNGINVKRSRPSARILVLVVLVAALVAVTTLVAVSTNVLRRLSASENGDDVNGDDVGVVGGGKGGVAIGRRRGEGAGGEKEVADEIEALENELRSLVKEHEEIAREIKRIGGAIAVPQEGTAGEEDEEGEEDDDEEVEEDGDKEEVEEEEGEQEEEEVTEKKDENDDDDVEEEEEEEEDSKEEEESKEEEDSKEEEEESDAKRKRKRTKAGLLSPLKPPPLLTTAADDDALEDDPNVIDDDGAAAAPPPRKYWIKAKAFASSSSSATAEVDGSHHETRPDDGDVVDGRKGAIIPFDLSVNHLQRVVRASGSPNDTANEYVDEEFLPVVSSSSVLGFRWRSRARPDSRSGEGTRTTAYRIEARRARHRHRDDGDDDDDDDDEEEGPPPLWDSGKVNVPDGLPDVVLCTGDCTRLLMSKSNVGTIVDWRVTVWDSSSPKLSSSSTSEWTKFAIGPSQTRVHEKGSDERGEDGDDYEDEWTARWISHPIDVRSWSVTDAGAFWGKFPEHRETACRNWERRSQLPVFRARLDMNDISDAVEGGEEEGDEIASALLVVSGLGSFRVSFDGVPLSSSGPLDPPLTDFAQRVSYRGYDVTKFLSKKKTTTTKKAKKKQKEEREVREENRSEEEEHVVGISMGSGWWDHRPITGGFIRLYLMPHGAVTCIAQLYVTYKKSGTTKVLLSTGHSSSGWQVAKGHLRESSLFSGEYIDLQSMANFRGWDTREGWSDEVADTSTSSIHSWVKPLLYKSDTTLESWRTALHLKSNARKTNVRQLNIPEHKLSPIGRLVPIEIPPVMPVERVDPDEMYSLGQGRWMLDFGKGFSGMVRFQNGLPEPIVPVDGLYPRGHGMSTLGPDESFITVVYGDSIELSTGDINIAAVAGMGLHDGGPRHKSKPAGSAQVKGGPCYPEDHFEPGSLLQRDVYILPRNSDGDSSIKGSFADARQSHFTTHSFRFAEICCTAEPPLGVHALVYRTAFKEWGDFSSSNVRINGGYELVKNAMNSNMLGVQSDCPHREKIQYGGDIIADSPASLHMYDMSSFYRKVVFDWRDQQWDNGAYAGTSHWLNLNDYAGIGHGAGETVWASAPTVMTVRHMQHYGDLNFLEDLYNNHLRWFTFLQKYFDEGIRAKNYDDNLRGYLKEGSGLGDWLSFRGRDTWLAHQSFYMATARSIAYMASKLDKVEQATTALEVANSVKHRIARLYLRKDGSFRPPEIEASRLSPGPEISLYSRVVPGNKRCTVLHRYLFREGHTWPGSEEAAFLRNISDNTLNEMIESGEVTKRGSIWSMGWSQWYGFSEGILAVRYALKTLSENGLHNIALAKAAGYGVGTFEYQLSHNATTHWESWWRSEDLYSKNHPMLGASAEWMASAVAGVALHPTTTAGKKVLFWPRFPNSASAIVYAGATQGTTRGDFSIAWKFEDLPMKEDLYDSAVVKIHIRLYVPPDGNAIFRLPEYSNGEGVDSVMKYAIQLPDIEQIKALSSEECNKDRKAKKGFNYNWEYGKKEQLFVKVYRKKAIGTPCSSFLFHSSLDVAWSSPEKMHGSSENGLEVDLAHGLYDVMVDNWQLKPEVKGKQEWRIASIKDFYPTVKDIGPYCSDSDTYDWNAEDASHLI